MGQTEETISLGGQNYPIGFYGVMVPMVGVDYGGEINALAFGVDENFLMSVSYSKEQVREFIKQVDVGDDLRLVEFSLERLEGCGLPETSEKQPLIVETTIIVTLTRMIFRHLSGSTFIVPQMKRNQITGMGLPSSDGIGGGFCTVKEGDRHKLFIFETKKQARALLKRYRHCTTMKRANERKRLIAESVLPESGDHATVCVEGYAASVASTAFAIDNYLESTSN